MKKLWDKIAWPGGAKEILAEVRRRGMIVEPYRTGGLQVFGFEPQPGDDKLIQSVRAHESEIRQFLDLEFASYVPPRRRARTQKFSKN
jgi:hypothetical protein